MLVEIPVDAPPPPLCLCSSPLLSLLFLASPSLSSAFISRLSSRSSISYRLPTNPCARARSLSPQRRGETSGERERESRRSTHPIHSPVYPSIHPSEPQQKGDHISLPTPPHPSTSSPLTAAVWLNPAGCAMGQACGHALLCRSQPPSSDM